MKANKQNYTGLTFGLSIGIIVGIAQDNLGLWISLGLAIGAAIDYTRKKESPSSKENKNTKP